MPSKISTSFNMYEMNYIGGTLNSDSLFIPLEEKRYNQYINIIDDCYYQMRAELNIKPYDKHSYSLEEFSKLKDNTFMMLNREEIICAVTCMGNWIENAVVNPKHQRQGYGRKLMEFAISHLQKRGESHIRLTVAKWNEKAIALYKSLGFEIVKEEVVHGVNTTESILKVTKVTGRLNSHTLKG